MELTFYEVATAVGAKNDYKQWPDFNITGVEFDSRQIEEGNLFVPLAGQHDGHSFIDSASDNGAIATLWSRDEVPNIPYLQVDDVLFAFQELAHYYRHKINPFVIAITGSNGKTTTKDFTASVVSSVYKTYKTQGNYNNDIGLPYTILHMPQDTEYLVLEMGMDGAHQIDRLSEIAEPDLACITMIGESHLEHLGTREGIARAKMEICTALKEDGTLIIPADEPLLLSLAEASGYRYMTFALDDDSADMSGHIQSIEPKMTTFTTNYNDEELVITTTGAYNVKNAILALLVGMLCQVPFSRARIGLLDTKITKSRTEWLMAPNGAEILSDVYNSNPTAVSLVLENFKTLSPMYRKIVVLGDMLELGVDSLVLHRQLASSFDPETIQDVYLYGEDMYALYQGLKKMYEPEHLHYFDVEDKEKLMTQLKYDSNYDTMILLKGSNGMGLNEVVDYLMEKDSK